MTTGQPGQQGGPAGICRGQVQETRSRLDRNGRPSDPGQYGCDFVGICNVPIDQCGIRSRGLRMPSARAVIQEDHPGEIDPEASKIAQGVYKVMKTRCEGN